MPDLLHRIDRPGLQLKTGFVTVLDSSLPDDDPTGNILCCVKRTASITISCWIKTSFSERRKLIEGKGAAGEIPEVGKGGLDGEIVTHDWAPLIGDDGLSRLMAYGITVYSASQNPVACMSV